MRIGTAVILSMIAGFLRKLAARLLRPSVGRKHPTGTPAPGYQYSVAIVGSKGATGVAVGKDREVIQFIRDKVDDYVFMNQATFLRGYGSDLHVDIRSEKCDGAENEYGSTDISGIKRIAPMVGEYMADELYDLIMEWFADDFD